MEWNDEPKFIIPGDSRTAILLEVDLCWSGRRAWID